MFSKKFSEFVHHFSFVVRHRVNISVKRYSRAFMTGHFRHRFHIHSIFQRSRRKRCLSVRETVKSEVILPSFPLSRQAKYSKNQCATRPAIPLFSNNHTMLQPAKKYFLLTNTL